MHNIFPSEDIRPISQFAKLLKQAQRNQRPVFLAGKDRVVAVLMSVDQYERLLKLAEFHKIIRASEAEADCGEVIPHEQVVKESRCWIKKREK